MNIAEKPESLREHVYEDVRQAIISGQLKPGDIVREPDLGRQYGTSRTPVREALSLLAFQGFLTVLPRVGYQIASVSMRDVQEAHHLRKLLELEAVRLACERITEPELDSLSEVMSSQTGQEALFNNRIFHMIIARASGSERLARLIEQLLDDMDRMQALDPHIATPSGPYEHADLVAALRRRDVDAALSAMEQHVDGARVRILERF
jgi:DNA-binding GntR family transcriptional regulator